MNTREYIERLPQTMGSVSACEGMEHTVYENVDICERSLVRSHFAASVCMATSNANRIVCASCSLFSIQYSHLYYSPIDTHAHTYTVHTHTLTRVFRTKKTDASQQLPVVVDYTFQCIQHICLWVTFCSIRQFYERFWLDIFLHTILVYMKIEEREDPTHAVDMM